jgi:hypothetical protein
MSTLLIWEKEQCLKYMLLLKAPLPEQGRMKMLEYLFILLFYYSALLLTLISTAYSTCPLSLSLIFLVSNDAA